MFLIRNLQRRASQQTILVVRQCLPTQLASFGINYPQLRLASSSSAEVKSQSQASLAETREEPELDKLYSRIVIETRGHEPAVLQSYEWFSLQAANHLQINVHNTWIPDAHILRKDALKSIHIYKKHMVQYEFKTFFRVIELKHLTGSTADTYLEYIQRNLPEGVAMKVTKTEIEELPSHFKPPTKKK